MIQNHAYLIRRNGIFYFSRRVPADVRSRFNKDRVIVSLHTRSLPKAQRSAAALSDRLERYWDSIRLEVFHTRELGLSLVQEVEADRSDVSVSIQDALDSYLRLKGAGRSKTFFQGAERAVGYLTEATDAEELSSLSASDAARFRDHLIGRGMTAASVRRVFAPHRCPGQSGPKRHSIPMVTLSFVSMNNTPLIRCYYIVNWEALRGGWNLVAEGSPEVREPRNSEL